MILKFWGLIFLICFTCFFSCKKAQREKIELNTSYYPLNIGHQVIYLVDSIVYDNFTKTIRTYQYKVKQFNESSYKNTAGSTITRAELSFAPNRSDSFTIKNAIGILLENNQIVITNNNVKSIPITFPISKNRKWNIFAQSDSTPKIAQINSTNTTGIYNGISLKVICVVQLENDSNLIERNTELFYYAPNIGLVAKEIIHIESQNISPQIPISNRATKGYKLYYTLENYIK